MSLQIPAVPVRVERVALLQATVAARNHNGRHNSGRRSRLLLIAQPESYRIAPFLAAADQLNIDVLIASRGEFSLVSEVHAGVHIDFAEPGEALNIILEEARSQPFDGVIGSDDSTVELAAEVAKKLGLLHNPPLAAKLSRRKDLARAQLSAAGCPVPIHRLVKLESDDVSKQIQGFPYPCVAKPLNLSASQGVIRADSQQALLTAFERIKPIIEKQAIDDFEKIHVLIEEFIHGEEVAFEGYLSGGRLTSIALFDKPDPMDGPFFEETLYITPSRLDLQTQQQIHSRIEQACTAYGLVTGPVHAELRVNNENAWILEIASRTIGGDCARTLDDSENPHHRSLEELVISLAMNESIEHNPVRGSRGVMMIPVSEGGLLKRVEGLLKARSVEFVKSVDIIVREGNELTPLPEGNSYLGYIFAEADTPEQVESALRKAYQHLLIIVSPLWQLEKLEA